MVTRIHHPASNDFFLCGILADTGSFPQYPDGPAKVSNSNPQEKTKMAERELRLLAHVRLSRSAAAANALWL